MATSSTLYSSVLSFFTFTIFLVAGVAAYSSQQSHVQHGIDSKPVELNVDAKQTYDENFMSLMQSPCRPEPDGYFGATYGDPVKIKYGFRLEVEPLSSISDILDVIEDKLVDDVLSKSFPKVCGFRRGRNLGHSSSGFRFYQFQEIGKLQLIVPVAQQGSSISH
mmetsp:Transcript_25601/g.73676  ORF Transcript_25601/g.73676 Transcript_25601/m.73676 type:complete len:164 (-) Transcript_25601:34-525(-)